MLQMKSGYHRLETGWWGSIFLNFVEVFILVQRTEVRGLRPFLTQREKPKRPKTTKTYHCENPFARGDCWLRSCLDACVERNLTEAGDEAPATVDCGIAGRLVQCSTIVSGVDLTAAALFWLAEAVQTSVLPAGRCRCYSNWLSNRRLTICDWPSLINLISCAYSHLVSTDFA